MLETILSPYLFLTNIATAELLALFGVGVLIFCLVYMIMY